MVEYDFLKRKAEEDAEELVTELERELGVPDAFLSRLLHEDDWSFIIKTHALVETAVNHAIDRLIGNPRIAEVISGLALNNARTGKIAFLKALEQADKPFVRFVDQLSRIRNSLVHDVRNTALDLQQYVAKLSPQEFGVFVDVFGTTSDTPRSVHPMIRQRQEQLVRLAPKESIWHSARFWLARVYLGSQHEIFRRIEAILEQEDD